MTDKKISQLTNITGSQVDDANDELAIVDTSASETKAITVAELSDAVLPQGLDTTDSPEFAGLTVDTDTLYVDSSNNRVGIGTSSPDALLSVGNETGDAVYQDKTSKRVQISTNIPEDEAYQRAKITINTIRRAALVKVFWSGKSGLGVGKQRGGEAVFNISRVGAGANVDPVYVLNGGSAFGASISIDHPTVSGNDVLFGFRAGNNGTGTNYGLDIEIELISRNPDSFIVSEVTGTTASTGASLGGSHVSYIAGSEAMRIDSDGRVGIGTSSPSEALEVSGTIAGTSVTATEGTFSRLNVGANLEWNASTDTYTANTTPTTVTKIHQGMKRCVLNDDGSVNYYLDPTDSTKKLDGTDANIDGTDGNVMVEIPKFYFRQVRDGNTLEWQISDVPLAGYQLHPAFFKNGEIVDFRYIGAYDACVYDDSAGTYIAGLNLNDNTGNIDTANDKLASVSGVYPMVGVPRDECRSLAANNGTGWRQQDFWLTCAVQMLYLVEYGDFNSQSNLGDGNTNGGYLASSADQNDSPHTVAGASNSWGNASTDGSQPSAGAKPGTAYMSYRGIENFFGNCWNWVDGVNIGSGVQGDWHASNNDTDFADSTTTNYEFLVNSMPADGYVEDIADVAGAFIPSATGGSSSTYLSDFFSDDNGNTNRVARFGGNALFGARAGAFVWRVNASSNFALRGIGARLCY